MSIWRLLVIETAFKESDYHNPQSQPSSYTMLTPWKMTTIWYILNNGSIVYIYFFSWFTIWARSRSQCLQRRMWYASETEAWVGVFQACISTFNLKQNGGADLFIALFTLSFGNIFLLHFSFFTPFPLLFTFTFTL